MAEVKLKEEQELWEPQEVDNSVVREFKEEPDCGGVQSPHEAGLNVVQIKEEPEELQIKLESIQAFPVIVSVRSENEEALLHETVNEETREDRDGESSSDTDDSGDWTPSAERPTSQTQTEKPQVLAPGFVNRVTLKPHSGESFKCSICSKTYLKRYNLEAHMTTHTGEMPFKCSICLKRFIKKNHLTQHMTIHIVERPYRCSVCSKGFLKSGNLTTHMMIHTGETPFSCTVCSMAFMRKAHLESHMRAHTGERPFRCPVCSRSFTSKSYLTRVHMESHVGEQPVVSNDQTVYCVYLC